MSERTQDNHAWGCLEGDLFQLAGMTRTEHESLLLLSLGYRARPDPWATLLGMEAHPQVSQVDIMTVDVRKGYPRGASIRLYPGGADGYLSRVGPWYGSGPHALKDALDRAGQLDANGVPAWRRAIEEAEDRGTD